MGPGFLAGCPPCADSRNRRLIPATPPALSWPTKHPLRHIPLPETLSKNTTPPASKTQQQHSTRNTQSTGTQRVRHNTRQNSAFGFAVGSGHITLSYRRVSAWSGQSLTLRVSRNAADCLQQFDQVTRHSLRATQYALPGCDCHPPISLPHTFTPQPSSYTLSHSNPTPFPIRPFAPHP